MTITSALTASVIAACGGGGGGDPGRGVAPPPPRTTLASVDVSPASAEVALDSALVVTATAFAAANTSLPPAVAYAWSRRGTAGGTITGDGGTSGATYRAGGPGVDTLTVTASAPGVSATATASAVVTVRGPRVARVTYLAQRAYVGVGGTLALAAVGRDATGAVVPRAVVTYRAELAGPVTVADDGTLTGTAAGTARVIATANTGASGGPAPADTLDVVIAGGADALGFALVDTLAQPGRAVTLLGADLAGAAVTLDGTALAVTAGVAGPDGSGGVVAAVPGSLYPTCRPLGATAPLVVTAAGRRRTLALAVYAPLAVALAPGQHRRLTEAAAGGCPVAVDQAGTYVAMPFAWDRQVPGGGTAGGPTQAVTTPIRVSTGGDALGGASPLAARVAPARITARLVGGTVGSHMGGGGDVIRPASAPAGGLARAATFPAGWSGGACPIPTTVGEAMPVGTLRDGTGRFIQPASVNGGGGTSEPWTLAAIAPTVAVFFDSALVRANLPGAAGRAQAFAAAYDSTVAPLLATATEGVPDADGNGRVVVLVALRARDALASPTGYARPDCEANGFVLGEALNLGGDAFVAADAQVAPSLSVATHEAAHIVDGGQRYMQPSMRQDTWWSREGYAVLMQHLWSLGPTLPADVFTANRGDVATRTILGTTQGGLCEAPDRTVLGAWYGLNSASYTLACQAVRYALGQLAVQQPGLRPTALLTRWSQLRDRRRFTDALNGLLGQSRAAPDVAGEWYLSWLADGLSGTTATLQDPAADLRARFRAAFPGTAYPVPVASLAPGQTITATLGEPDAVHVQVDLPAGGWVAVTLAGGVGLPTARTDVMLFRAK